MSKIIDITSLLLQKEYNIITTDANLPYNFLKSTILDISGKRVIFLDNMCFTNHPVSILFSDMLSVFAQE